MRELRDILRAFDALEPGDTAALASIVHSEGSTYRRTGARSIWLPDGSSIGVLSGGCIEGDLAERARRVVEAGAPTLVRYDTTDDHDALLGTGLGCRGVVDILVEPVTQSSPGPLAWLAEVRTRARARRDRDGARP